MAKWSNEFGNNSSLNKDSVSLYLDEHNRPLSSEVSILFFSLELKKKDCLLASDCSFFLAYFFFKYLL
jgi:hypothetical protein